MRHLYPSPSFPFESFPMKSSTNCVEFSFFIYLTIELPPTFYIIIVTQQTLELNVALFYSPNNY